MGQPWGSHGAAMGQPWGSHGAAMGPLVLVLWCALCLIAEDGHPRIPGHAGSSIAVLNGVLSALNGSLPALGTPNASSVLDSVALAALSLQVLRCMGSVPGTTLNTPMWAVARGGVRVAGGCQPTTSTHACGPCTLHFLLLGPMV